MEEPPPALAEVIYGRSVSLPLRPDAPAVADPPPGQDLAGNTFWEFKDIANANRFRRIVKFDPKTHYSDVQVTREFYRRNNARFAGHGSVPIKGDLDVVANPLDVQHNGTNGSDTFDNIRLPSRNSNRI